MDRPALVALAALVVAVALAVIPAPREPLAPQARPEQLVLLAPPALQDRPARQAQLATLVRPDLWVTPAPQARQVLPALQARPARQARLELQARPAPRVPPEQLVLVVRLVTAASRVAVARLALAVSLAAVNPPARLPRPRVDARSLPAHPLATTSRTPALMSWRIAAN